MGATGDAARDAWLVDSIRFTSFPVDPPDAKALRTWWSELTGEDSRNIQKSEDVYAETGSYKGKALTLGCQGGKRVDWVLKPEASEEDEPPAVLNIGGLKEGLDVFLPLVEKWLAMDSCPKAKRLALGTILLQPVEAREKGYRKLQPYLTQTVILDPVHSSDFRYTINRRRDSAEVPGMKINQYSTWFVWTWKPLKLTVRVQPDAEVSKEQELGGQQMACRVDLDVNTAPEYEGEFEKERQKALLQELRRLTEEIASNGDVP